ncbi:MAG: transporter substrate-binding domain-containing protein [Desulfobacterales bacterium]|nr:transporter substrate-binding domain-containing protein [Desulfobacterales bacterium]MCP4162250.1 transporter substrate-binding domain-containing protein [Deltaproteobacteria bacterium]
MKRVLIFIRIIIVVICIENTFAFAGNLNSVYVVCENWPGYTNKDGTGVYWEIVKAVYEPVGIKVKTSIMPWKRANHQVLHKSADAILGDYYHKNQSGKDFRYPNWHISVEDPIIAFFKKGTITAWKKKGVKAIDRKIVGWIRGYDFDKKNWFKANVIKVELTTLTQGIKMIAANRLDVFIDYESAIKFESRKLGIDLKKYDLKTVRLGEKLFLKFSNTENSKELIKFFDKRMTILSKSGKIENIYKKWGHTANKFSKDRYGIE